MTDKVIDVSKEMFPLRIRVKTAEGSSEYILVRTKKGGYMLQRPPEYPEDSRQ